MSIEKLEIPLHGRGSLRVIRIDAGVFLEVYALGNAQDGHGFILQSWTRVAEADISALLVLLTTHGKKSVSDNDTQEQ